MYKDVLRSIEGVGFYPSVSFAIFGLFFLSVFAYIAMMKKTEVDKLSHMPLEDNTKSE